MSKLKQFVKRRKGLIIFLVIALIIVVAAISIISNFSNAVTSALTMPSISQLVRQDISNVIMASGNTSAVDVRQVEAEVSTAQGGYKISSIDVEVGDTVMQGQVIAMLDTQDAKQSITDAQESVNDAYADIVDANEQAAFDLGVAQRQEADAQNQYNIAKQNHEDNLTVLNANLTAAQNAYNAELALQKAVVDPLLTAYGASLAPALTDLTQIETQLQANYDALTATQQKNPTEQAHLDIVKTYTDTIAARDAALSPLSQQVQTAQTAIEQAISTYEAQERQNSLAIESAKEQVSRTLLNTQSVDTANTQYDTAQTQLETAQNNLDDMYIYAPINGVVTQLNYEEGDTIAGALCTVQNLSSMQISTTVASYDVVNLQKGMQAVITTDSTGNEELSGYIESISPIAVDEAGNFEVVVRFDELSENLRAGVPSKITFLIEQSTGVFAVPFDAIVEEDGEKFIYVYDERPTQEQLMLGQEDGRRKLSVTTGLETDYYVEIISSELKEGMFIMDDPLGLNVAPVQDMLMMFETGPTGGGDMPEGGPPAGGMPG